MPGEQVPELLEGRNLAWGPGRHGPLLVDGVDITLGRGEMVGLIGPNGAGKSSLIRLLIGYQRPRSGTVSLLGRPLEDWNSLERARLLSYCAQEIPQEFPYDVRTLVQMGRFAHDESPANIAEAPARVVDYILEYTGLTARADQAFSALSGGEKQLALFARALAQDGRAFILDEPSSGLDMGTEHRLFSMLRELCMEGRGVLAAVHNLNTASEYCDRLVLMDHGMVLAQGTPSQVLREDLIAQVYGVPVKTGINELSGAVLVNHAPRPQTKKSFKVHIIGGGGSALNLTRELVRLGVSITAGVAHGFDSDTRLWRSLGIPFVEVPPFSPVDAAAVEKAALLMAAADMVIMTDFPLGPGNAGNLDLAGRASKLVLLEGESTMARYIYDEDLRVKFEELAQHAATMSLSLIVQSINHSSPSI